MGVIDCSKCIHYEVCGDRFANDGCAGECSYFIEYNPSGDCISREALIREIGRTDEWYKGRSICDIIDNAQAIPLPNEQTAWEQGYEAGLAQGKHDRPKGEWIKVTKAGTVPVEYICSLCRRKIYDNYELTTPIDEFYPFCHCGADMRKGGAE